MGDDNAQPSTSRNTTIECGLCREQCISQNRLVYHEVIEHSLPYCVACNCTFRTAFEKKQHLLMSTCLTCYICKEKTKESERVRHLNTVHGIRICPLCSSEQKCILNHLKRDHACSRNSANLRDGLVRWPNTATRRSNTYTCRMCGRVKSAHDIVDHVLEHHSVRATNFTLCNRTKTDSARQCRHCRTEYTSDVPQQIHDVTCRQFQYCRLCEKFYSTDEKLEMHIAQVHSQFACIRCSRRVVYTSEDKLVEHLLSVHEVTVCIWCGHELGVSDLPEHLRNVHTCIKHCTEKSFNVSCFFMKNENLHCYLCEMNFSTELTLDFIVQHILFEHKVTLNRFLHIFRSLKSKRIWEKVWLSRLTDIASVIDSVQEKKANKLSKRLSDGCGPVRRVDSAATLKDSTVMPTRKIIRDRKRKKTRSSTKMTDIDSNGCRNCEYEIDVHLVASVLETQDFNLTATCELCAETFDTWMDLSSHYESNHEIKSLRFPYACSECGLTFHHKGVLMDHRTVFHGVTYNFKCPHCPEFALRHKEIRSHICQQHREVPSTEELNHSCAVCSMTFWDVNDWSKHIVSEHLCTFHALVKCHVCLQVFASKECLADHLLLQHPQEEQFVPLAFRCCLCLALFPTLGLLHRHMAKTHRSSMIIRCCECGEIFKTKNLWMCHARVAHSIGAIKTSDQTHNSRSNRANMNNGFKCRLCSSAFGSKKERQEHYKNDHMGEDVYQCNICGKGFVSRSGMHSHKQLHTGSGKSKCEYCGKEFARRETYAEHLLIHVGPRHKCLHCNKQFVQRSNLVRHVRIHTGEKPYKCTYCDKRFSDKGACTSHENVHTRERECSCPYCGRLFSKKQKLKYHIRKHTGEDLVVCDICGKKFTNNSSMKDHRQTHDLTQASCPHCERVFSTAKNLRRHIQVTHDTDGTLDCFVCQKVCPSLTRYKSHLLQHAGIKQMKCKLCEREYTDRKSVRKHLVKQHNILQTDPSIEKNIVSTPLNQIAFEDIVATIRERSEREASTPEAVDTKPPKALPQKTLDFEFVSV